MERYLLPHMSAKGRKLLQHVVRVASIASFFLYNRKSGVDGWRTRSAMNKHTISEPTKRMRSVVETL